MMLSRLSRLRRAVPATTRLTRSLCAPPPRPPPVGRPGDVRPDAETVKNLAENAKLQQRMWDTFVPEGGIKFGDRKFWGLLFLVLGLHGYNTWNEEAEKAAPEPGLPRGAVRRLPDGRMLMEDGSITERDPSDTRAHTLHQMKEKGEDELVLDKAGRWIKENV